MFKVIPAAKASGDLSMISALGQSIKAAIQSGDVPSSLTAMLGDPISSDFDVIGSEIDLSPDPANLIKEDMNYERSE